MHRSILGDVFTPHFTLPTINLDDSVTSPNPLTTLADIVSCSLQNKKYAEQSLFLLHERFIFVVVLGSTVCVFGIVANAILLHIFADKKFRRTNFTYLLVLAVFDITICVNYILLIGLGLSKDYFRNLWLHHFWYFYFRPLFTLGRIVQVAQTCLILATTVERYISVYRRSFITSLTTSKRVIVITGVVVYAVASKASSYWELDVVYTNCSGFASIIEDRGSLAYNHHYNQYRLYVDPVLQTYIPFLLLLLLNLLVTVKVRIDWKRYVALIVNNMLSTFRAANSSMREVQQEYRAAQSDLRDATLTTAGIVTGYLISNALNVVLTFLEQTQSEFVEANPRFHSLSADISSFLVILTSSARLPLYYFCNSKIRRKIRLLALRCRCHRRRRSKSRVLHYSPKADSRLGGLHFATGSTCGDRAIVLPVEYQNGSSGRKNLTPLDTLDELNSPMSELAAGSLNSSPDRAFSTAESLTRFTNVNCSEFNSNSDLQLSIV